MYVFRFARRGWVHLILGVLSLMVAISVGGAEVLVDPPQPVVQGICGNCRPGEEP